MNDKNDFSIFPCLLRAGFRAVRGAPYLPLPCLAKSNAASEHVAPTPPACVVNCRANCTISGARVESGPHSRNGVTNTDTSSSRNTALLNRNSSENSRSVVLRCATSRQRLGRKCVCRVVSAIQRRGSNARVSALSPERLRQNARTAPATAVCHSRSRPNTSACSKRSSSRSVHASAKATKAPTTYDANLAASAATGEENCATYFVAGLCAALSLWSRKCGSSLNSRMCQRASVDHCRCPALPGSW